MQEPKILSPTTSSPPPGKKLTQWDIPVQDAEAALHFCQGLAAYLANPSSWSLELTTNKNTHNSPVISVVIPVYNEEDNLSELYTRLTTVLSHVVPDYELVFVNDGSLDHSLEIMHQFTRSDSHILVVDLARNFGHQIAISAGLDHAQGLGVIIMDADLQDPPEVLPEFIAKWQEGHDVVYAIRQKRKESWLKCSMYHLFYLLLQRVANIQIPLDAGDFCIMDKKVVDLLNGMPERNRFVRGIRSWVGLDQVGLAYERQERNAGKPKYTFSRLVYLALDGLVSFSFLPLRLISILGLGISFFSIVLALFYVVKRLTVGLQPPGFATTIVAILFLAGIQLVTTGVIGEYVGRIFEEVKQRPLYITRRVIRGP